MSKSEIVYCSHCKKDVHFHFDPVHHWRQLFISLFSLGLWLPVWAAMTFAPSKICDECGNPLWDDASTSAAAARRSAS